MINLALKKIVNHLILLATAICKESLKGVQSCHAGKDVRPTTPFRLQLRRKTQWEVNQLDCKQSVFLRIQLRASSQTKGLE